MTRQRSILVIFALALLVVIGLLILPDDDDSRAGRGRASSDRSGADDGGASKAGDADADGAGTDAAVLAELIKKHGGFVTKGRVALTLPTGPGANLEVRMRGFVGAASVEVVGATDETGAFLLAELPRTGVYAVSIAGARVQPLVRDDIAVPPIEQGGPLDLGELVVNRLYYLVGRVLGEGQRGVAGARVSLLESTGNNFSIFDAAIKAGRPNPVLTETRVGADGRFSLELTAPGIFTVRALADGWAPHYRAEVIIGGVADTEIVLPLTQGYAVVGYALDATNRPVGDTAIALYQMNRRAFSFSKSLTRTDGGGRFEFRVEPSAQEYTVSALFKEGLNIAKRFRVPLTEDLVLRTPGQGALLGRVVDARTGQGVPGASVLIVLSSGGRRRVWGFPEQGKALKTDDYGAFRLEGIGAGSIQSLRIRAVGHPDLQLSGRVSNDPELWARIESIELTGAGETELPTIQLEAGRPLRGVITDRSDDKPIDGARVEIWDFMMGSRETFSDAEGRYAFDAVGERVSMVVEKEGYAPFRESPFPGHQLGGGESAALRDFQLEAGGRVEGQVKTAAGEPVARALVRLRPADAGWRSMGLAASLRRAWTHTDEEGNYVLSSVPAAKLYAEVEAPGYDIGRSEQKQIEAGQLLKRLDISMQEAARLEGRVLSRDSTPVPGVRITVARDPGPDADVRAQWMALRDGIYAFGDDQGRFSVLNVPVGDVIIRLEADGYATTTMRRSGVQPGQRISKERLEMAPAYSISGRLVDPEGQPFTRAWVRARHTASPDGEPVRQVLGARLESDGRFAIRNMPAGAYTIEVRVPSWGDGPRYENISQEGVSAGTQDLVLKLRERPPGDAPQRRRSRGSD